MARRSTVPAVLILLSLLRLSVGDSLPNEFIYPGPSGPSNNFLADVTLSLGSVKTISWTTTTATNYQLWLYQQNFVTESGLPVKTICTGTDIAAQTTSCTWTVQLYNTNLTFSPVYFLWHNPGSTGFTSHYFNITDPTATSSAASSSTLSSSSTVSSSTTTSSTQSTTSTTPGSSNTSGGSNNSVALDVGLGVGLGVGIPLVLIAGIFLGLRIVKERRQAQPEPHQPYAMPPTSAQETHYSQPSPFYQSWLPVAKSRQEEPVEIHEAPSQEPGWGPQGRYEADPKTPRPSEM